jgi:pyruvate kinase
MQYREQSEQPFAESEYDDSQLTDLRVLLAAMQQLRQEVAQEGDALYRQWQPSIQRLAFALSGHNLAAYLALRQRDLRPLQAALMPWGLSSLGRGESRVLANLDAVIATLAAVVQEDKTHLPKHPPLRTFFRGERLLSDNAETLFGKPLSSCRVRIMVTLPAEAAHDDGFVRDLLQRGMNCVRINCAYNTPAEWEAMIANVRRAEQESGRTCKVLMDLAGPKARTGHVALPEPKQRLHVGERVLLTRGTPVVSQHYPVQVACQLPEVLDQLLVGAEVWIDQGKLGTQVEAILPEGLLLRVTHAREKGERLRLDKGLNFPGTGTPAQPVDGER